MSERFIKFIPSKEALHLARKHPNAFILLMFIAERARRYDGDPDGLTVGQCQIGDHKEFGLTEKEYRTAKKVLAERKLIKIIETCRTRKTKSEQSQNKNSQNSQNWATERATRSTTIGTLVDLCTTEVWDINLEDAKQPKGDRLGDRGATEGRPKGDELRKNKKIKKIKKIKKDHPSIPSDREDRMTDEFSSEKEKVEIISGIFLTQEEVAACIEIRGSIEKVKEAMEFIQSNERRRYPISDWPNAVANWKIESKTKLRLEENIAFADKLCEDFDEYKKGRGWRCYNYHDRKIDQKGILFEPESAYKESIFVALIDGEFKQKCDKIIILNSMRKK